MTSYQIDFRLDITSGGFGVYWIQEELSPTPGFIGSWELCGAVSSGGHPWSPPSNVDSQGNGAYSVNGELYFFQAQGPSPPGRLVADLIITDTGIAVVESTLYGYTYTGREPYLLLIIGANGKMYKSSDDGDTWAAVTSSLPTPPSVVITPDDINNANNTAPPGLTFVFGTPEPICGGGVNSHTGPPAPMQTGGGGIEHAFKNIAVSARAGVVGLTASIVGPIPPVINQGGLVERAGIPVRSRG